VILAVRLTTRRSCNNVPIEQSGALTPYSLNDHRVGDDHVNITKLLVRAIAIACAFESFAALPLAQAQENVAARAAREWRQSH